MGEADDAGIVGDYQRAPLGSADSEFVEGQEGCPAAAVLPQPAYALGGDVIIGYDDAPQAGSECVGQSPLVSRVPWRCEFSEGTQYAIYLPALAKSGECC